MNVTTSRGVGLLGLTVIVLLATAAFEPALARGGPGHGPTASPTPTTTTPASAAPAGDRAGALVGEDEGGRSRGSAARAYTGQRLAGKTKVTIEQARAIALRARHGQITDEELERERGGSGLRYSFDVKNGAVTHEVGVDARTGRVLENKAEGPLAD